MGWTQQEIGEALGVTQQGAAKILQLIPELEKVVKTTLDKGIPDEVAQRFSLRRALKTGAPGGLTLPVFVLQWIQISNNYE